MSQPECRQPQNRNQPRSHAGPASQQATSAESVMVFDIRIPRSAPPRPKSGGRESLPMENKNPPERTPEPINRTPKSSQIGRRTLQTRELLRQPTRFWPKNRKQAKTPSGACHRSTPQPPETSVVTSTRMYPAEPAENPADPRKLGTLQNDHC